MAAGSRMLLVLWKLSIDQNVLYCTIRPTRKFVLPVIFYYFIRNSPPVLWSYTKNAIVAFFSCKCYHTFSLQIYDNCSEHRKNEFNSNDKSVLLTEWSLVLRFRFLHETTTSVFHITLSFTKETYVPLQETIYKVMALYQ